MSEKERLNTEITRWYVCLVDDKDREEMLCVDLPDDLTQRIDKIVKAEYDVTWKDQHIISGIKLWRSSNPMMYLCKTVNRIPRLS